MESDEEDFVFYGTPIEREEEITSRKKKAVAEASGHLRTLVPWKQEVTDEEGRRRFHGAFTGGFSAGYYNTVGSKEGWTPQSFTSSRKNRAEIKQQSIVNFLDDDEKAELEGHSIGMSMQFDTFGFTASELARKQAEKEQQQRPSAIPGSVPDELVVPATDSIGVKLLLKMGWRRGHSLKDSRGRSLYDARREARKALLAFSTDEARAQLTGSELPDNDLEMEMKLTGDDENKFSNSAPVYVLHPKQDLHGLGYDPFKHAPEFREKKRSRLNENREIGPQKPSSVKDSLFGFKSGRIAPGFGIGALEDLDAEDEDVYASGYNFEETYVQEFDEPPRPTVEIKKNLLSKDHDILPGFKVASKPDYQMERFDPPIIPKDFVPNHTFSAPLQIDSRFSSNGDSPPEVPPPEDNNLKILVEGMATLVARCGRLFEDLSREKNQSNPLFSFLNGGIGHDYYVRKLWEERQKRNDQTKPLSSGKSFPTVQKITAERRGKILGEKPLERSSKESSSLVVAADTVNLQINLSDTFTTPASLTDLKEASKPFRDDPAKQERFEQFLKEKYQGGLRSKDAGGASRMSEAARARERLEFEAAAEAIEKGKHQNSQQLVGVSTGGGLQFTSGGVEPKINQAEESIMKKLYPRREEFQWRPSPTLCKRFDLVDPYMGKPPPAPRARSKMDSLIFMPDMVKATKVEDLASANKERNKEVFDSETKIEVEVDNVERPVDLYKAIFSDDDEDEEENSSLNKVDDPEKKIEAANTTLNRLIAGDFLESLGKELGLEVPPDIPCLDKKAATPSTKKEDDDAVRVENANMATVKVATVSSINQEAPQGQPYYGETAQLTVLGDHKVVDVDMDRNGNKLTEISILDTVKRKHKMEAQEDARARMTGGRDQIRSGSSSDDEQRSRKHSRHHRRRSSYSDSETTDISDDYRDRHYSRSKSRKEVSSREKGSSRRHPNHHKHRSRYSPRSSTRHGYDKEQREGRKERRKLND